MFSIFKRKKKRKVYRGLKVINFCGKIERKKSVVIKFPEDPTLFSFSLPAIKHIEEYFSGTKYGIFREDAYPFVSRFLRYTKLFPNQAEHIKKIDFNRTILIDFELAKEKVGTAYPFEIRIGFKKELYPEVNIIYAIREPTFPDFYENVVKNIIGVEDTTLVIEQKTKKGWAWEFVKYLGMTGRKKILAVDFNEEYAKLRKVLKERHSDRWFLVFFDELHDVSIDQKLAILLIADAFLFDTSYYAHFAVKEGIKSYKLGELPFNISKKASLSIIEEKDIPKIIT